MSIFHIAIEFSPKITSMTRLKSTPTETSLVVYWLGLWASTAGVTDLIPVSELSSCLLHGQKKGKEK